MIKAHKDILLADDYYSIVELLKESLEEEGYTVDTAYTVEETISKIDTNSHDVLILDYNFNEEPLNGETVMQHINKYNKEIIVFANSCDAVSNDRLILLGAKCSTNKDIYKILEYLEKLKKWDKKA